MHPSRRTHPKLQVQSQRVRHADLATGNLQCYRPPRGGWGCWLEGPVIDRPILWMQAGLFRSPDNLPCGFSP